MEIKAIGKFPTFPLPSTMSGAPTRYVDQEAFERYADQDGQEIVVTQLVPATPAVAFDTFLERVWKGGALSEVRPGQGRGQVGHTRTVPLGVHEEILSAGKPCEDDEDAIPSVLYKLVKFGALPLQDHLGFVQFVKDESSVTTQTLVMWTVKIVPTMFGNIFCCGGSFMRVGFRGGLASLLRSGMSALSKNNILQD
jgi:hypothetical protein